MTPILGGIKLDAKIFIPANVRESHVPNFKKCMQFGLVFL